jgi:hypothetical protein
VDDLRDPLCLLGGNFCVGDHGIKKYLSGDQYSAAVELPKCGAAQLNVVHI